MAGLSEFSDKSFVWYVALADFILLLHRFRRDRYKFQSREQFDLLAFLSIRFLSVIARRISGVIQLKGFPLTFLVMNGACLLKIDDTVLLKNSNALLTSRKL